MATMEEDEQMLLATITSSPRTAITNLYNMFNHNSRMSDLCNAYSHLILAEELPGFPLPLICEDILYGIGCDSLYKGFRVFLNTLICNNAKICSALLRTLLRSIPFFNLTIPEYGVPTLILERLLSIPCMRQEFVSNPSFLPLCMDSGSTFQKHSLLSPFLTSMSPSDADVVLHYFGESSTMSTSDSTLELCTRLGRVHIQIRRSLVKLLDDIHTRQQMLSWIACFLLSNWTRTKYAHNRSTRESSEPYMLSISSIMMGLCQKYVHNVDFEIDYLLLNSRLEIDSETRISATFQQLLVSTPADSLPTEHRSVLLGMLGNAHLEIVCDVCAEAIVGLRHSCHECDYDICDSCTSTHIHPLVEIPYPIPITRTSQTTYPRSLLPNTFYALHTEVFFLTGQTLHLGLIDSISRYPGHVNSIHNETSSTARRELLRTKHAYDTQILSATTLSSSIWYYSILCEWCLNLDDEDLAIVPEYLMYDMSTLILFVYRCRATLLERHREKLETILHLCCRLVSGPLLRNPDLRVALLRVFAAFTPPTSNVLLLKGIKSVLLTSAVNAFLLTGVGNEHIKLKLRYQRLGIAGLLSSLISTPQHIMTFVDHDESLLRMLDGIMSDLIFCFDETLSSIESLVQLDEQVSNRGGWDSRTPENSTAEADKSRLTLSITSHSVYATNCLVLLWVCSNYHSDILLSPALCSRYAHLLNYYVQHINTVFFEDVLMYTPFKWLAILYHMYTLFPDSAQFNDAVVSDERCFSPEVMLSTLELLSNSGLSCLIELNGTIVLGWSLAMRDSARDAIGRLKSIQDSQQLNEHGNSSGFVPDEFLDPLTLHIMDDPVTLPTSGVTVDRGSISRHLLSQSNDPYNRMALTRDMLISSIYCSMFSPANVD